MSAETYEGKPCARKHVNERGRTLRYRSNRKCIACCTLPVRYYLDNGGAIGRYSSEGSARIMQRIYGGELWRAVRIDD